MPKELKRPKYQLFDELSTEEFAALEAEILREGIQIAIEFDEDGEVLDGHNRLAIAEKHGLEYPWETKKFDSEVEKELHVLALNMARRHLKPWQWGCGFKRMLELKGIRRGLGKRNDLTSETVSEVSIQFGVDDRTARNRMKQHDEYEKLTPKQRLDVKRGKTPTQVKRAEKDKKKDKRREKNRELVKQTKDPRKVVGRARFATIVIDPPWDFEEEGDKDVYGRTRPDYAQQTTEQIIGYPVKELADEDCHLYLWITNRSLISGKGWKICEAWGFRPITVLTWCKPSIGIGNYFRNDTEHVIFGVRGQQPLKVKNVGTWFRAERGPKGHSSKPEVFYSKVETWSPGPYVQCYARDKRKGWTCLGAEV